MFYDLDWVAAWTGEPGRGWRGSIISGVRRHLPRFFRETAPTRTHTETP